MGTNNTRLSPRQKMINLMYIVLTAMLALNVSSDVLDGFTQVNEGLNLSNANVSERNTAIYARLEAFAAQNPEKGGPWLAKATEVRKATKNLSAMIDSLSLEIVREADGPEGNPADIKNRDDLESAAVVMLSPGRENGAKLRRNVDSYRELVISMLSDSVKIDNIRRTLSTASVKTPGTVLPRSWESARFEQQPVVAAVTLLAKLRNDVLYSEGEALSSLLAAVDANDVRVNELNAFVMPQSRMVMRGGKYSANIMLAAVDTTARPLVFVNGRKLDNDRGLYELMANTTGSFDYSGYVEVPHDDGSVTRLNFKSDYTVIEPMATVAPTMMNVLYAGIDNPVSISVPGVAMSGITATMTNGTLSRRGDLWTARPQAIGKEAVITVTADIDGRKTQVATSKFRVRKLPDPTAFIAYRDAQGNPEHYKGGRPFSKSLLLQSPGIEAAIDDGLLDTKFTVKSFETVFFDSMGNAIPEVSDGANFSSRQKQQFQRLSRGKRFYISRIKAAGPDGTVRDLSPVEVIIG